MRGRVLFLLILLFIKLSWVGKDFGLHSVVERGALWLGTFFFLP